MQIELIMYLAHGDSDYSARKSWKEARPRPGSLFIVGDPKQSIYRFRRADISIYNELKDLISKFGEVVYLDINFRSSDGICQWVQDTFTGDDFGFPRIASESQAAFEKILAMWDDRPDDGEPIAMVGKKAMVRQNM